MFRFLNIIFCLLFSVIVKGQTKCVCLDPSLKRIYTFSDGNTFAACGFIDNDTFSEFSLYHCQTEKLIYSWDATENCLISKIGDTLIVSQLFILPIGKNFQYQSVPLYVSKIFFANNAIVKQNYFNPEPRYTSEETTRIYQMFDTAQAANTEANLQIADMIFWAHVSGDQKAASYFYKVKEKFAGSFDGYIAEEWNKLNELFDLYNTQAR